MPSFSEYWHENRVGAVAGGGVKKWSVIMRTTVEIMKNIVQHAVYENKNSTAIKTLLFLSRLCKPRIILY